MEHVFNDKGSALALSALTGMADNSKAARPAHVPISFSVTFENDLGAEKSGADSVCVQGIAHDDSRGNGTGHRGLIVQGTVRASGP